MPASSSFSLPSLLKDRDSALVFIVFFFLYVFFAWLVCGGGTWWVVDFVDGQNIFDGDDAYRFFLSRGAWINPDLYNYNFVLPGQLLLDGSIISLFNGDLFLSRCAHAAVGALGLAFVYQSGIELGLSRRVMVLSILVVGLLPRYALMSLSFYGEVWLAFFLSIAMLLYLRGRILAVAVVASWMPLLRPEGIFFLAPIALYLLLNRRLRELAFLLFPGAVYFVYLCISLPSLHDYIQWRIELRSILDKIEYSFGRGDITQIFSYWMTVPAACALMLPRARRIWPFLVGSIVWVAWLQTSISRGMTTFESRYVYVLLPVVGVLWATFYDSFIFSASKNVESGGRARLLNYVLLLATLLPIVTHIHRTDNIRQAIRNYGYVGLFERVWQGRWTELYGYYSEETQQARETINKTIESLLVEDKGIDKLAIFTSDLYYGLDPYKIPKRVTVGFLTNGYMVFHILLDGQSFIQHPGNKMYSYLKFGEPDFSKGEKRTLVATIMPLANYPYTWKYSDYELYLFSYLESKSAQVDISERPNITPAMIQEAYSEWYGK